MWKSVAASVGLLLLLVVSGCGSDDRSDAPAGSSMTSARTAADAVGPPSEIPWWSNGSLHVSEGTIPTRMRQVVARGGTTIIGRATSHGSTWRILRETSLVGLFTTRSPGAHPVLSADGRYAAWATSVDTRRVNDFEADTRFTITAYDVARGRVTGTTELESHTYCCDGGGVIEVVGVDAGGSVVLARYSDRAWIWRPGSEPVRLSGDVRTRAVAGNDPWPGGVSWTTGDGGDDPAAFGRVSPDGVVTRVGRVPLSQGGLWSPDGSSYAYVPFTKLGHRQPVVWSAGTRTRLQLRRSADVVGWESSRRLILLTDGLRGHPTLRPAVLARCDSRTGDCEQAGPPIANAHLAAARFL